MLRTAILAAAAAILAVSPIGAIGAAAAPAHTVEAGTKSLSSGEVYQLYANRSWIWKEGAGYFAAKKRTFTAWSREGDKPSYAQGRWFITEPGKLCFRADWHAADGSAPATTCFSHSEKKGLIYQRREPDGEWYVFKHARARTSDEFAKLRRGDHVGTRMNRIAAQLGQRQ